MLNAVFKTDKGTYDLKSWNCWVRKFKDSAPEAKIQTVDVPFSDGELEMTHANGGRIVYKNRKVKLQMKIIETDEDKVNIAWRKVLNAINGRKVKLTMSNNPDHYYEGRAQVGTLESNSKGYRFDIDINARPYIFSNEESLIQNIEVPEDGTSVMVWLTTEMPIVPTFVLDKEAVVEYNGITKVCRAGNNKFGDIVLHEGNNIIAISGNNATCTIKYREGEL